MVDVSGLERAYERAGEAGVFFLIGIAALWGLAVANFVYKGLQGTALVPLPWWLILIITAIVSALLPIGVKTNPLRKPKTKNAIAVAIVFGIVTAIVNILAA